jgi:hypothetical protein
LGAAQRLLTAPFNRAANLARALANWRASAFADQPATGVRAPFFREHASVESPEAAQQTSPDREQKQVALSYVNQAWAEARFDGVDDDCMAMSCLFAAFAELVGTYGEEAAAKYADSLSNRIRAGEFTLDIARQ